MARVEKFEREKLRNLQFTQSPACSVTPLNDNMEDRSRLEKRCLWVFSYFESNEHNSKEANHEGMQKPKYFRELIALLYLHHWVGTKGQHRKYYKIERHFMFKRSEEGFKILGLCKID